MKKRRFSAEGNSPFKYFYREELGGIKLEDTVFWKEPIDEAVYRGSVKRLIEHPIHGDIVTVYCRHGGFRSKKVSEVSKKQIKKRGRGRPRKGEK
ncbi:MAG: hypothetical protein CMA72_09675 [Euryarchaeota archaeon]|nr:hypothetical protein [Euryarchaeota archaeon]